MTGVRALALLAGLTLVVGAARSDGDVRKSRELVVTATAYNSVPEQTADDPNRGAWGDLLQPGMRAIAVSRDLLGMGLTRGVEVTIDGLPGRYVVLDKMGERWKKRIDLYMGDDVSAARTWGVRRVKIRW